MSVASIHNFSTIWLVSLGLLRTKYIKSTCKEVKMFNNRGSFVWRLIGVLLLVGLDDRRWRDGLPRRCGTGHRPGARSGSKRSRAPPKVDRAYPIPAYGYGYPVHRMRPHIGFFPFGGIFGFILFHLPVLWVDAPDLPPLGLALWSHARTRSLEGTWPPLGHSTLGT